MYYCRRGKRRRRLLWENRLASCYIEAGELAWKAERVGGSERRRRRRSEGVGVEGDEGKQEERAQCAAVASYDIQ